MSSSQTPKDLKDFMCRPFFNTYYINYTQSIRVEQIYIIMEYSGGDNEC